MSRSRNESPIAAKIESLDAYLTALKQGADAGLEILGDRSDPEAIDRKLEILLGAGRASAAAELVRDVDPDAVWCDKAITALVRDGDLASARRMISWSQSLDGLPVQRRCATAYAEAIVARSVSRHEVLVPGALSPDEEDELREAVEAIEPVIAPVVRSERILFEVDARSVRAALELYYLLRQQDESARLARLLAGWEISAVDMGKLVIRGLASPPGDLLDRLQAESPDDLHARTMGAYIQANILGQHEEAFETAQRLVERASSRDERIEVCELLVDLAIPLGEDALVRAEEICRSLLHSDDSFVRSLEAYRMLRHGQIDECLDVLEVSRDEHDPRWLQMYAQCMLSRGDGNVATGCLIQAAKLLPVPDLLRKAAAIAYQNDRIPEAVDLLERLVSVDCEDETSRQNLAGIYASNEDWTKAVEHYGILYRKEPSNAVYGLNYAGSLACSGGHLAALSVYDDLCADKDAPVEGFVARAQLLKATGEPVKAFSSLNAAKDRYWGHPQFLLAIQDLAFASENEKVGHEALMHLRELQESGAVEPDILRSMSLDDVVDEMKGYRKREELVHEYVVAGRFPWLMAEGYLGRTSCWGWVYRTQPLKWIADNRLARAGLSIHSTNGFGIFVGADGVQSVDRLECPPRGTAVAIDLSALISLYHLDMLDVAAEYFGTVLVPTSYFAHAMNESARLVIHQLSQRTSLDEIKTAMDLGRLSVVDQSAEHDGSAVPLVHEHTMEDDDPGQYYRLRDIADVLFAEGRIGTTQQQELLAVAHKPARTDALHPGLQMLQPIRVDLSTLRTLHSVRMLDVLFKSFSVYISPDDRDQVISDLHAITAQERVRDWYQDLWEKVGSDPRFVPATYVTIPRQEEDRREIDRHVAIASYHLAKQRAVPLLADDRVCQSLMLNDFPERSCTAFGSDHLILALTVSGEMNLSDAADALEKMMGWRYRFIVLPASILKEFADRFHDNLPGESLRSTARYVQDCMRDYGIPSGFLKTDPPTTIANKLFLEWADSVASFIIAIWADETYTAENAQLVTTWALSDLFPSVPRVVGAWHQSVVASLMPGMVIDRTALRICQIADQNRSHAALKSVASALGLDEDQYVNLVMEVLNGF